MRFVRYLHTILLILLLFLSVAAVRAQQSFQGQVNYLMVSDDSSVRVNIESWFGPGKIKFSIHVFKAPQTIDLKNETIFLRFDSAFIDRVKEKDGKVERESMTGSGKKQDIPLLTFDGTTKTILDYPASRFSSGRIHTEEMKDTVLEKVEAEIKIWYADQFLYPVPDSLKMIQMVPLFTNGHVALGSEIYLGTGARKFRLVTTATAVRPAPGGLPAAVFRYPQGYPLIPNN